MAIVNCQNCDKRISDISPKCPHCGHVMGGQDDERALEIRRRRTRDHIYHLNMASYAVISVFLVAFGWYWWDTGGFQQQSSIGPQVLAGLTAAAYMWIRLQLWRARKELKRMLRSRQAARA